jgi:hypothetical protein
LNKFYSVDKAAFSIQLVLKEKNPWLLEKMFESRFPEASGREEG